MAIHPHRSLAREFPDYPEADLPKLPSFMRPAFHRNETCPGWDTVEDMPNGGRLMFYADYADITLREFPDEGAPRYTVHHAAGDWSAMPVFSSDNLDEALVALWAIWIGIFYHPDTQPTQYDPPLPEPLHATYRALHARIASKRAAEIRLEAWKAAGII